MSRTSVRKLSLVAAATLVAAAVAAGSAGADAGRGSSGGCASGQRKAGRDICVARGDDEATQLLATVRQVVAEQPIRGVVFGVWRDDEEILTGALGEALANVPASRRDHFRLGNAAETIEATILLSLVDDGVLSLDDTVSEYFPDLPNADTVTVEMLARSTSGYQDFVTTPAFSAQFEADPFKFWTPEETLDIAMANPPLFAPGTSWAFSDTNFVLLGRVLEEASGKPYEELIQEIIFDEVGMPESDFTTSAAIPEPTLHVYSNERGNYEEATYWSPSWVTFGATATSDLADMGKWTRALGEGDLLSKKSHDLQVGDENVGLGPLTEATHYGMGVLIAQEWILTNPQVDGYTGVIAYFPAEQLAVVIYASFAQGGEISVQYAAEVYNALTAVLTPDNQPELQTCPRGC